VVQAAHPELDATTARRTAETYRAVARQTGGNVTEMVIQSREAEQRSSRGENVTP
jgi:hypothetical protein